METLEKIGILKYNFVSQEESELSANRGETVVIVEDVGDGWCYCFRHDDVNEQGYIPTQYMDIQFRVDDVLLETSSPNESSGDGVGSWWSKVGNRKVVYDLGGITSRFFKSTSQHNRLVIENFRGEKVSFFHPELLKRIKTNEVGITYEAYEYVDDDNFVKTPLPIPSTQKEYRNRLLSYNDLKEERKREFSRKKVACYVLARKMYYHALRQNYFFVDVKEGKVLEKFQGYNEGAHKAEIRKIITVMRKLAECCYFIGRFNESEIICYEILKIIKDHKLSLKLGGLTLTYTILSRLSMEKKDLKTARKYLKIATDLDNAGGNESEAAISLVKEMLEGLEKGGKGDISVVSRNYVWENDGVLGYEIDGVHQEMRDFFLKERVVFVNEGREWCGNLNETNLFFEIKNVASVMTFAKIFLYL